MGIEEWAATPAQPFNTDELATVRPIIERYNSPDHTQRRLLATLDQLADRTSGPVPMVPAPSLTGAGAMFALPGAPNVTHEPDELAGEWEFVLAAHGSRQRMRHTELQALYRSCDAALNAARAVR